MSPEDTIVAVSTPSGRGGLGVLRLSGTDACLVAAKLLRSIPPWEPWRASLGELVDD
ncbi:MAG: tRNA uridine-5-carboxymethylaminomethyl(34) synthesis GTPase MnmE, partial [Acidobacteria bacterium]|nr:tRNA uridine-5-carboxymethylaminomethyl(34) synthesis GTPase MnmE [Acidobacteriota bacterium]